MGFVASEEVEDLTYNLNLKGQDDEALKGTIPEPSTKQVEAYRDALISSFKELGIEPDEVGTKFKMADLDDLMDKNKHVEKKMLVATANLTGIAPKVLEGLPYRPARAFAGWIMGQFFSPEALTPATKK